MKTLTAVVYADVTVNFETFLMNHPKLEELQIFVINDSINGKGALVEAIKRRCASGAYLKKVHLKISWLFLSCSSTKDD